MKKKNKLKHLFNRAGFGIGAHDWESLSEQKVASRASKLVREAKQKQALSVISTNRLDQQIDMVKQMTDKTEEERKQAIKALRDESKETIKALSLAWLERMASGKGILQEKMTLFWHGHFACANENAFYVQQQHSTIRQHALGKFGDLLMGIAKDSAMLSFLNNRQNKKDKPNENFAREVMELFTLGRGNYTETDIKNAARAFTGWNSKPNGDFFLNQRQHDAEEKTFFGNTGKFGGEDILDMILSNKQTARFLTTKLYAYFVNEQVDPKRVASLSEQFYKSDYDIAQLMEEILTSDWFYDKGNMGTRIKSPIELLAGMQHAFGLCFQNDQAPLFIQKSLGQVLFYPPNVAGWKEGKSWIDSSSLMFRVRLPQVVFNAALVNTTVKEDGDVNTQFLAKSVGKNIQATADWKAVLHVFSKVKPTQLINSLADWLLPYPLEEAQKKLIESRIDHSTPESTIRSISIALMTLPEYQLC
jgi:uncharacterized protein (DUF1800 family)